MKLPFIQLLVAAGLFLTTLCVEDDDLIELRSQLAEALTSVDELRTMVKNLTRQTMLQQFAMEERSRNIADSGIKLIRSRNRGLKNYESPSFIGSSVNAIHDHANYIRTMGMGEVAVMMNGVEFRTRHNDYKLVMPSTTSDEYQATEDIPFPEVPPSVTGSIQDQISEMSEWFKAFKEQDRTHRDYRRYFKPVLCYMEGAWTLDTSDIHEPFKSERHKIEAKSWFELQEKVKYSALTGTKNPLENFAYLPTTIMTVNDTGLAQYAQWNYRILCKPVDRDIPFSALKYVEDLTYRVRGGKSRQQTLDSSAARFKLYDGDRSDAEQLLDQLFYTVPGMDNTNAKNLRQETFGDGEMYKVTDGGEDVPLKTGFYHRQYESNKKGAMGLTENPRGFNDENLWVAQTTQSRIAPVCLEHCQRKVQRNGRKRMVCEKKCNRFTYAIPLEIIYLTPLLTWNPYNITVHQDHKSARLNRANGVSKPFNGADWNSYYLTPAEMFGGRSERDKADTVKKAAKVKDSNGRVRRVAASGTRIWTDSIPGVGKVRLRYPISPVADEGSSVWKELNAFKDYVYDVLEINQMESGMVYVAEPQEVTFEMDKTVRDPPGEHTHDVTITYNKFRKLVTRGKAIRARSSVAQGHDHGLVIKFNKMDKSFNYIKCGDSRTCRDGHGKTLHLTSDVDVDALMDEANTS